MSDDTFPIVYFCCPECAMVYSAKQELRSHRHPGAFQCGACATSVHEWTGYYNFANWKPVMRSRGHNRRFQA